MSLDDLSGAMNTSEYACGDDRGSLSSNKEKTCQPVPFCSCSNLPSHLRRRPSKGTIPDQEAENETAGQFGAVATPNDHPQVTNTGSEFSQAAMIDEIPVLESVSDLLHGESSLFSVFTRGEGGSEVVLTERRVLLRGAPEADLLHASIRLAEIDSVVISRARPRRRSLVWGLIGIGASIGIWQSMDGVGNIRLIITAVVLLVSSLLLADYFLRPPDLELVMRARSGAEMRVIFASTNADEADRFAAQVISKFEATT